MIGNSIGNLLRELESELESYLKAKNPNHPALKFIYYSVYEAIDAYYKALYGHGLFST